MCNIFWMRYYSFYIEVFYIQLAIIRQGNNIGDSICTHVLFAFLLEQPSSIDTSTVKERNHQIESGTNNKHKEVCCRTRRLSSVSFFGKITRRWTHHRHTTDASANTIPTRRSTHYRCICRHTTDTYFDTHQNSYFFQLEARTTS